MVTSHYSPGQQDPEFSTDSRNTQESPTSPPNDYKARPNSYKSNQSLLRASHYSGMPSQLNYKLILVGNSRVGKTSLTNRCIFDEFEDLESQTRVVQIFPMAPYNIEGTDYWVQAQIWDTLGQEKFHSLAPLFFRRSVGAFLVYDVTNLESFKAIDKWYQQILKNTDNRVVCMLIGNKKDKARREVSYKMAAEYAKRNNFGLMEVSAKSGSGVKDAFGRLIQEIYRQIEEENDPDRPLLVPTSDKIAIVSRPEIFSDSFGIKRDLHYAKGSERNNQSPRNADDDLYSNRNGSTRTFSESQKTKSKKKKCCA